MPETPQLSLSAEIIAVGTELLMGEVVNSNASYLSKALAELGIDVYYHVTVGDNPGRIQAIFKTALSRSNVLLVTGGLGPTEDDLTVATLADLLQTPLVNDEGSEAQIRRFFMNRNRPMSNSNLKQALRPENGEPLFNRMGTAPGLFWDVTQQVAQLGWGEGPKYIFAFPGVPREMKTIWAEEASPKLQALLPSKTILRSRFLKFVDIGESLLAEKLQDVMAQVSPTVSPYVGQAEVRLRIAAKAPTIEEADAQIQPTIKKILSRVGEYCYGEDDESLEMAVASILQAKSLTVSTAESCTGGLLSSRLTDVSGSSAYTVLNVVTYSNKAKVNTLGVSAETLLAHGAVSEPVAQQMAEGLLNVIHADVGVSITGIAGPTGGTDEKPVGLAYIGIAMKDRETIVKKITVNSAYDRAYIKYWFTQYALIYLRQQLLN